MGEAVGVFIRGFKSWMDWLPIAAMLLVGILCAQPALGSTTTVGTIAGQFSVSPTGAATYQIPLDLPPGVNGLKPSLALLYNSQAGNGFLGEGWSLTGLSVISRCPQTLDDQTPAIHIPDGTSADRFCLDGQRLILTSGTYGAAGSVYHTEIESFQQATASGSAGGGPASFTVVDRSGLTRVYSTVPFTCTSATVCPSGAALEWLITKITDRYGNFISFSYDVGFYDLMPNGTAAGAYGIQEIDYGNSQGTIVGRALFTYDNGQTGSDRPDSHSTYVGATGVAVDVNAVILTGITVKDGNGAVLRTYNLSYNNTGFSPDLPPVTLASVQECGSDGTCFSPTSFTDSGATSDFYGGNQFGNDSAVQGPNFQVLDLDGDGLPDYIYAANNTVYAIFGDNLSTAITSIPWATSSQTGIGLQTGVVTDLNGGAQQELLVPYYSHPGVNPNTPSWYLLSWNGQAGTGANISAVPVPTTGGGSLSACAADDGCTPDAVAVDMNGNGEPGLLFADGGTLYYYANVSGALSSSAVNTGITYSGADPKLIPVNYDGQGTPEVYVASTGVVKWNRSSGVFQLIASGNFSESNGNTVQFINSSGLSSAVVMTGSNWWYCPNTGSGFLFLSQEAGNPNACTESAGTLSGEDLSQAQPVDFYGDGRQEILVPANSAWWLFNGVTFTQLSTVQVPYAGSNTEFIDVNGDGRADMLFTSNGHTEYYFNNASPYLLNQITNGLGHNTDVGYVPLTAAGHSAFVTSYPSPVVTTANLPRIRAYVGPMYVVDDFAVDSGLSNSNGPEQIYTYYKYGGPALDQWGRGFLGFARVEAINYNTGLYTDVTYRQDIPFTGMVATSNRYYVSQPLQSASPGAGGVKIVCTRLTNGEPDCEPTSSGSQPVATFATGSALQSTTNTYPSSAMTTYSGVFFPYASISETQLFDLGTGANYESTTTNYTYQSFSGTPIGVDVMPTDINVSTTAGAGSTTTTAAVDTQTGYGDESSCPGHATSVTVADSFNGATAPAKTESFQYDGNCFLTQDTKTIVGLPSGGSMTLTKQYTPDGYGNPVSSTVSGTNVAARTTGMSYDPSERFPVSITNALGQTESLSYNDWGEKLSDTDANGDTITYQYYGLGRIQKQSGPEPTVNTNWSYSACSGCVTNAVYEITQTGSDGSQLTTQYDELGRALRTTRLGFSGESILQDTQYDLLGRISQTSVPFKSGQTECWDTKSYDVLNRVTTETQPYNATTTSCGSIRTITPTYNGLTTSKAISATGTSVTSETITTTLNALGKPATATDTGGTTAYGYDPWGDVTSVTPPDGATVSMTYDSAGDKWSMHDPDMGAWSYTYDALGELLTQTDAKNQTVSNIYDALGRLVSRTEPEGTSLWKYDIAYGAGIGRLAYKQGPNGVWEGYAYDAYGHPTDKITVVNGQEYWVTTTYDDQGRVSQVVYPNLTGINVNSTPATPTGLQVTVDANNNAQFDVSWTAQQNGEIYHLYRTASGSAAPTGADEIYSGPNANWPDDGITVNGSYEWWLKACNDTNCSGYATTTLTVTLPPTVPGTPSVPASDTHAQSIALSWAGSSLVSTTTGPITYEVLESYTSLTATQPGLFTQVTTSSSTSATVSLSQDGTYVFAVKACASGACSAPSLTSAPYLTHLLPGTPTNLYAAPNPSTNSNYSLYWTGPSSGGAVTSYTIYCSSGYCPAPTSNTSVALGGNADGTYSYYVKACNAVGCGPAGNTASETVLRPPGEPSSISLSPTSTYQYDTYTLSWGSASGTVTSYEVNGNLSYSASTFSASYSKFKAGNYTYYVQACNSSGCGPATATVTETVMSGTGGCKTCAPTNGATTAPTQSTSPSPTQAPSASSGSGGLADVVLPALRLAASINLNQPLTVAPLIALSTPPIPPTVRIRPLAARPAFQSAPATAPIMSAREAFFLAHADELIQSTKPMIQRERRGRVTAPRRDIWHTRSRTQLVAQNFSPPSFEKGGLGRIFAPLAQAAWHYAPAINPQLSEYPPLRHDPRILAHFESLGGQLPGKVEQADCGGTDSDRDCSQPTGGTALMVGYVYNSVGYLVQVQKLNSGGTNVRVLWQATDETALGQVDQESFDAATDGSSPAFSINNIYDAATGVLVVGNAEAAVAGDQVDYSYTWDGYNNVLTRNLGETVPSGQTAPPTLHESFTYDALNRLSTISTNAGSYSNSESMNYNAVGGFLTKGNYTNYQYSNPGFTVGGYTYSQPHAVSSVTTPAGATRTFTYDADGNLLTESGDVSRSVTWTSYNKPSQITGNGAQETFVYGPDRSRLVTAITKGSDTVTTTYIDGLFEQVYDSATGNLTYRHYILAGGARVGVETIAANNGGTITADTLSFYVHDEVGSVIATVTESLGGANQTMSLTSYDAWGKARPTTGSTAYEDPVPGTFYSPTPAGQQEGFAGHDNLSDTGLVDMEGRVYDPEVGTFLSADPNVQYPFSSQGYDRYLYVNDNPLSLSDPSGYFSLVGYIFGGAFGAEFPQVQGRLMQATAPFLNLVPYCQYWCAATAEMVGGYLSSGGDIKAGIYAAVLTEVAGNFGPAMTTATGAINWTAVEYQIANSVVGAVDPQAAAALALAEGDYHEFARGATTSQGLKFAAKYLGEQYVQWKARQETARVAERNGMNLAELDAALFGLSELGNLIVGTRYTSNFEHTGHPGEEGFFSHFGGLLAANTTGNKAVGFLFDATDTLLGMQGLPTASDINAITSSDNLSIMTGHSLGAIGVNNLTAWGYVQSSTLDALPFPNVGVGNTVELQIYDGISGSILGWLTNPDATRVTGTCWHRISCGGFFEPPNH